MEKGTRVNLYPLKFKPLYFDKIWGGSKIHDHLQHKDAPAKNCGEVWLLSAVTGSESVVTNGKLKGNTLSEVYEVFLDELVGENIYNKSPDMFPLLIKIIDANHWLSIQVHPNDELAMERYNTTGKTELWYIMAADKTAKLISGFSREIDRNTLLFLIENGLLKDVLKYEEVIKGDVFFIPAGRVHAIGPGIMLAEIQQTSDKTYRLYDWDRTDKDGNKREIHLDKAFEAVNYSVVDDAKIDYHRVPQSANSIISSEYFSVNIILAEKTMQKNYSGYDTFIILFFTDGEGSIIVNGESYKYNKAEVILLPATTQLVELSPDTSTELLEIFIEEGGE